MNTHQAIVLTIVIVATLINIMIFAMTMADHENLKTDLEKRGCYALIERICGKLIYNFNFSSNAISYETPHIPFSQP